MLQLLQGGRNVLCCAGATIYDTGAAAPVILPVWYKLHELLAGLIGQEANAVLVARIMVAALRAIIFFIMFSPFFVSGRFFAFPYTHFYIYEKNYIRLTG